LAYLYLKLAYSNVLELITNRRIWRKGMSSRIQGIEEGRASPFRVHLLDRFQNLGSLVLIQKFHCHHHQSLRPLSEHRWCQEVPIIMLAWGCVGTIWTGMWVYGLLLDCRFGAQGLPFTKIFSSSLICIGFLRHFHCNMFFSSSLSFLVHITWYD
jgi:hypothetical protein